MDFYNRRKIYLIVLLVLVVLIPILFIIFYTVSPGLNVDANLDLTSNPILNVHIKNDSSHIISNLSIIINDKDVNDINSLGPGKESTFTYHINTEKVNLIVNADNHLSFNKTFTINKNVLLSNILDYSPSYIFNKVGKESDINLKMCSTQDINVSVDVDLSDLIKGKTVQDVSIYANTCKTLEYSTIFRNKGEKKIKFKIYNEVYSKELLISGNVK